MPITIPQTQTILQSYFQTGDEPTQDEFLEFIGTMFYLYNQTVAASNTAIADATAAQAAVAASLPRAYCTAVVSSLDGGGNPVFTLVRSVNIAGIAFTNSFTGQSTITFTAAFLTTYYNAIAYWNGATAAVTKNTGTVVVTTAVGGGVYAVGMEVALLIL